MKKYDRLKNRLKLLCKKESSENTYECYSIEHFFECETYKKYERILEFVEKHNFKRVIDIGCAFGIQSEVFVNSKINYVGIEIERGINFWNKDKYKYIIGKYPFRIDAAKGDIAVSILCLTWNCYLEEKDKTLHKQLETLKHDFKHIILYTNKEKLETIKKYYKNTKKIDKNLYYFYN